MNKQKKAIKKKVLKTPSIWSIPLKRSNFILFGIGIATLIIGFYLMTIPPWNSDFALIISPLVLLIGYFLIFVLGILKNFNGQRNK